MGYKCTCRGMREEAYQGYLADGMAAGITTPKAMIAYIMGRHEQDGGQLRVDPGQCTPCASDMMAEIREFLTAATEQTTQRGGTRTIALITLTGQRPLQHA